MGKMMIRIILGSQIVTSRWVPGEEMSLPKEIKGLIERFRDNRDVYCSSAYNEAQARHEFIDPLGHKKSLLQRQIGATDRQIDQLVYELYGLTDEEGRLVEEQR